METQDPFEGYQPELFPRLARVGRAIKSLVHFLPDTPLASHGDHLPNTGAGPMLDQQLALDLEGGQDELAG